MLDGWKLPRAGGLIRAAAAAAEFGPIVIHGTGKRAGKTR
jgi:hypothetical protein